MDNRADLFRHFFMMFSATKPTDDLISGYVAYTAEIPYNELEAAIGEAIRNETGNFAPAVGKLRQYWLSMIEDLSDDAASEQWGRVRKALAEVGSYGTPNFVDPITARIVKDIGWLSLCQADTDSLSYRRHDFIKTYNEIMRREKSAARLSPAAKQIKTEADHRRLGDGTNGRHRITG